MRRNRKICHRDIRANSFKKYIRDKTNFRVQKYALSEGNHPAEYINIVEKMTAKNKDIKGLFVPNSSVHYFAELLKDIKIIGYDLIEANATMLETGNIDFLINQQPSKQGELALESLFKSIVLEEDVKEFQYLPIEIICRENLGSFRGDKNG